jgi:hypothetical protein
VHNIAVLLTRNSHVEQYDRQIAARIHANSVLDEVIQINRIAFLANARRGAMTSASSAVVVIGRPLAQIHQGVAWRLFLDPELTRFDHPTRAVMRVLSRALPRRRVL